MEAEAGQWRINNENHMKNMSPFKLLKPSGNLQWVCQYETGQKFTLGRKYVERFTVPVIICDCEMRPIVEGDYLCQRCRAKLK